MADHSRTLNVVLEHQTVTLLVAVGTLALTVFHHATLCGVNDEGKTELSGEEGRKSVRPSAKPDPASVGTPIKPDTGG